MKREDLMMLLAHYAKESGMITMHFNNGGTVNFDASTFESTVALPGEDLVEIKMKTPDGEGQIAISAIGCTSIGRADIAVIPSLDATV